MKDQDQDLFIAKKESEIHSATINKHKERSSSLQAKEDGYNNAIQCMGDERAVFETFYGYLSVQGVDTKILNTKIAWLLCYRRERLIGIIEHILVTKMDATGVIQLLNDSED